MNRLKMSRKSECSHRTIQRSGISLGQHRTIASADISGFFAPIFQFEKLEIHPVFLRFPNLILGQNLSLLSLAELCGAALDVFNFRAANFVFFLFHILSQKAIAFRQLPFCAAIIILTKSVNGRRKRYNYCFDRNAHICRK